VTPLIGITGRTALGSDITPKAPHLADSPVDWFFGEYASCVREAGGLPVELPVIDNPSEYVERLDAVILSGGGDVDPKRWNGPSETSFQVSERRDAFEFALLQAAIETGTPVLGICRGLQVINVHFKGSLIPHLDPGEGDSHSNPTVDRQELVHSVSFEPESILFGLHGSSTMVNSFHHQAADRIGLDLHATGHSSDGTVEGIEHSGGRILGVQWHPEMLKDLQPVFGWVVQIARSR
tara:strand:+ start:419 stop:1129 length:711 start_codon:yes stop_codon:yes gene_type:complete